MMYIQKCSSEVYEQLIEIWEASVRKTHDFLKEEDIQFFRPLILGKFFKVLDLYVTKDETENISGFMGVSSGKIEMLFVKPEFMGKGTGKLLVKYGLANLNVSKVDVNEQNQGALGFYKHMGFEVVNRLATDSFGKKYPILEMALTP